MTTPQVKIVNIETGEEIVRDMNAEELAQLEATQAEFTAKEQARVEQATAKAALLDKLGITEEEATLLLGGN